MPLTSMLRFRTTSSTRLLRSVSHIISDCLFLFAKLSLCPFASLPPSLVFSRWVKQENEFTKQAQAPDTTPKLDLGFKEGQTITLNIGVILFSLGLMGIRLEVEQQNSFQFGAESFVSIIML